MPEQLESAFCPVEVKYLWEWFVQLSAKRTSNGFGSNRISDVEIMAWSNLRQIKLTPFDMQAIDAMDNIFMQFQNSKAKK